MSTNQTTVKYQSTDFTIFKLIKRLKLEVMARLWERIAQLSGCQTFFFLLSFSHGDRLVFVILICAQDSRYINLFRDVS